MKIVCTAVLALFCFATFASAQQKCADWPEFLNTNMRRENPCETILNVNNVANLTLKWSYAPQVGDPITSPVVANGTVYFGAGWDVYALNASTGALAWDDHAPVYFVNSTPALAYGAIYVGSQDNHLYALNAQTGHVLWSFAVNDNGGEGTPSAATVLNGVVYFGAYDGNVYALDARSGAKLWSYQTGYLIFDSPAVVNNVVYVGSGSNVFALDATSGTLQWTSRLSGLVKTASPAVADGVVYIATAGSPDYLYAIDAATGALLWSEKAKTNSEEIDASPALAYGNVYVGIEDTSIDDFYALNGGTGAVRWSYSTGGEGDGIYSAPAVANGVVYFGSRDDGNMYAFNATTGTKLWSYPVKGLVWGSPVVSNGMVYITTTTDLYAFGLN